MSQEIPPPDTDETAPQPDMIISEKERINERIMAITTELMFGEHPESFPFPGFPPEIYAALKADEEELPGYGTPVDELIERFAREGMKVVLGKNPQSGNVFVMPMESDDIENDAIRPSQLDESSVTDELLRELIVLAKSYRTAL